MGALSNQAKPKNFLVDLLFSSKYIYHNDDAIYIYIYFLLILLSLMFPYRYGTMMVNVTGTNKGQKKKHFIYLV